MADGARRVPSAQRLQDRSHHHALPQRMSDTCWGKRAVAAAAAITRRRQRRMPHFVSVVAKRARAEESSLPGRPDGRLRGARPPSDVLRGTRPPSDVYTTMERPCLESWKTNVSVVGVTEHKGLACRTSRTGLVAVREAPKSYPRGRDVGRSAAPLCSV
ncbi:hypothetical protein CDEST_01340 [Colletotrichum destructivum]|uniref:Uncharacterized protein n=1 Tax=Colletotrichum destructivum TaxID=34406 RepID=A0AAX4HYR4_9PEZI|nr:hypothetical protein CDEST_01340 [Colletotrichum destructivum]